MVLEGVIVCVNYSDFLSHTLPLNKGHFDKLVVVTDTKDIKTHNICEFWNVFCVKTDEIYVDNSQIPNKGIAINAGLRHLSNCDWVLHMDADIFLPPMTRNILESYPLDKNNIYGTDRMMCNSFEDWHNFLHGDVKAMHEGWIYLHTDFFNIGTRLIQYQEEGYLPIGFFQLWNPKVSNVFKYPTGNVGYDRSDVVFAKKWPKELTSFIPSLIVIHLANQKHGQGQNWKGRKTRYFQPNFRHTEIKKFLNFCEKCLNKIRQILDGE